MHKALKEPLDDFRDLPWEKLIEKYDKYSLRSYLTGPGNLSADTLDYISVFYNTESFVDNSLMENMIDMCVFEDSNEFYYVLHGMDLLPRAMAENLNNVEIQYNSKVTEIDQNSWKIRVKVEERIPMLTGTPDKLFWS